MQIIEKKDKVDFILKFLALFGAIFSFFWGIHRYNRVKEDESIKAFWNQQFPIYKDLCMTASTIATSHDSILINKATDDFWRMYYGEARMVVDWEVHLKMSAYASILKNVERGFSNTDELLFASFELASQCRKSLAESWDIPLSELKSE